MSSYVFFLTSTWLRSYAVEFQFELLGYWTWQSLPWGTKDNDINTFHQTIYF